MKLALRSWARLLQSLCAGALLCAGCYYSVSDPVEGAGGGGGGPILCTPACAETELCVDGSCTLNCAGFTECGGQCKDTSVDPSHCGACGTKCDPGQVCDAAQCKATCSGGKTACGASCVDLLADPSHCGGCGIGCSAEEDCVQGGCEVACESLLLSPITDPWGNAWDGEERPGASFDAASQNCDAFRARLPLATEVYRLRSGQPKTLPNATGSLLWTLVPANATAQLTVRANNGTTATTPTGNALAYRCMCPGPIPSGFGSGDCLGSPGSECFSVKFGKTSYNVDRADRPGMPKPSAMFECGFAGGRLATAAELVGAIGFGLPGGTDFPVFISDDESPLKGAGIRWIDEETDWNPQSGSIHARNHTDFIPGRCFGPAAAPDPHPNPVPKEFVSRLGRKADGEDAAPLAFDQAIDACWARGGHLPGSTELAELILEGMPGGSGQRLVTADHASDANANGIRWSGVQLRFAYAADADEAPKPTPRPFRCIFYPIESSYVGPGDAACSGGCMRFDLPGGASVWADKTNRAPAAGGAAARDCAKQGGRLTSVRDLLELIPKGLPISNTGYLHSLEIVSDPTGGNWLLQPHAAQLATAPNNAASYEFTQKGSTRAYRCLWTNEVR